MKLLILSDMHLEHLSPHRRSEFWTIFDPPKADVLILAGDIDDWKPMADDSHSCLFDTLQRFCNLFEHVIYVPGNHEYYGTFPGDLKAILQDAVELLDNLHWLDCSTIIINGQRFVGGTMWFSKFPRCEDLKVVGHDHATGEIVLKHQLNDYNHIVDFIPWVYEENQRAVDFLHAELKADDIVVTHHLPSFESVASSRRYLGAFNNFYVCDQTELIEERSPAVWIHGHSHEPKTYTIGNTLIVSNPQGYPGEHSPPAQRLWDHITFKTVEVESR